MKLIIQMLYECKGGRKRQSEIIRRVSRRNKLENESGHGSDASRSKEPSRGVEDNSCDQSDRLVGIVSPLIKLSAISNISSPVAPPNREGDEGRRRKKKERNTKWM